MPRWAPPRACVNTSPSWPPSATAGRKSGSSSPRVACASRGTRARGCPSPGGTSRAAAPPRAPIPCAMANEAKEPDVTCFSAQVAEVEVDPDTGAITVRKFVTAPDVGTIHNPMTPQGQIDGAIMQGVGYALMEQLASEEGHISTLSMGEVKTPTMQDM